VKLLFRTHRYLSALIAPAMIFFAVSGAWQAFRLHESRKDGSYEAPAALTLLSQVHKAERLSQITGNWLRGGEVLLAVLFISTALVGITMALKVTRPVWLAWLLLAVGVAIPVALALVARR
jgi:hypothetical protein